MTLEICGHRGARGLRPENTLPSFVRTLEIGVHAIELDVGMTADDVIMVTHDPVVSPLKCRDVAPATPGDPLFPYVGRTVRELTLAQLKTLDCGVRQPRDPDRDPFIATQLPIPGTPMPTLAEVAALVAEVDDVRLVVELKSDPTRPTLVTDPVRFTAGVVAVLDAFDLIERSTIQSFDWRVLLAAERLAPQARRAALVEEKTAAPETPWLAGLDPRDFCGDLAAAAALIGAEVLAPRHTLLGDDLMERAAAVGLPVVVWTVNEEDEMAAAADLGVAGIITDYPDRLRAVVAARGLPLPAPCSVPALVC